MHSLLFVTRKWDGRGGMQQLSRDVWKGMEREYGKRARLCALRRERYGFLVPGSWFLVSAFLGLRTLWRGGHVHLGDAALAPFGWLLKKVGRGWVTVTACGLDVIWPRRWYQWLLQRTLPAMDRIVCISHATAEEVQKRGVDPGKIRVIPCGVWSGRVNPNRAGLAPACRQAGSSQVAPLLLTVGRLVPRKGIAWFAREVVPLLLSDFPRLQYAIVGSGPEELLIKKIIQDKGLECCVHLWGELNEARQEESFALADLFIAPNIPVDGDMEGFGIVCIEAGLRGIPVVAARLEGLQEAVIDERTGRFFAPGDAEDCALVIRYMLLSSSPLWDRELVARATLEHYGWPRLFRRYRDEVFGF